MTLFTSVGGGDRDVKGWISLPEVSKVMLLSSIHPLLRELLQSPEEHLLTPSP